MASKRKQVSVTARMEERLNQARKDAETFLRTARKRVDKMLPAAPRKQIAQFGTRVEKMRKELERNGTRALRDARSRVEDVIGGVEKQAVKMIRPVVARLDVASKSDVDRLRKRIADLELRVHKTVSTAGHPHAA